MSSLRNQRVVIASLFLPTNVVLGESVPSTPDQHKREPLSAGVTQKLGERPKLDRVTPHTRRSSITGNVPGPPKSLVEDLKDRTTPASQLPASENGNPFTPLNAVAASLAVVGIEKQTTKFTKKPSPPPPSLRKRPTIQTEHRNISARIRRNKSRSTSRRPDRDVRLSNSTLNEPWHFECNPHCNSGLKNAVDSVGNKLKKLWVGTLATNTDSFGDPLRKRIDLKMLEQCSSIPVWIRDAEFESCYDEFCHQVLWPCLHSSIPDAPKAKLFYESAAFKEYTAVNKRFADTIITNYQDGDIIWVNDYHLMLLPALLRASPRFPSHAPIGFFMHVAFPSSEIFRCISARRDLLKGLLAANLVGFQTASFARHFRQTVNRILAYEALPSGIQVNDIVEGKEGRGRFVDVGVFPMGIDVGQIKEKMREPEVAEWVQLLKQRYAGMKLIVGRDKLDTIQGVRHKIKAFETFLEKNTEFQQRVVLIQVAIQTTESSELAGGVADVVSHVNSRFSTLTYQPVVFLHTQDLTFSQYLALLIVADAFLVTSLREGMALRAHEFVECQEGTYRPLILSEFTGSYSYSGFRSCIAINPWDTHGTANAINQALTMSDEEARSRWEGLHKHVITQTAQAFVTSFLTHCIRSHAVHVQGDRTDVPVLDLHRILPRYKRSQKRLILIDFEGTLWQRDISRASLLNNSCVPPKDVLDVLRKLADDDRNDVWLLSGLPVKDMLEKVAASVPHIGIVAENGCFIKTPEQHNGHASWIDMVAKFNLTWKTSCLEILNYFTERTPGSFVEEREASVVWRYWTEDTEDGSDQQWARRQAAEAQNHIFDSLGECYGLRIIPGKTSFLVLPNNVSRSTAVGAILHPGGPTHSPLTEQTVRVTRDASEGCPMVDFQFMLAVSADEKLLRRLNEFNNAETCSTSGKGSEAKWMLDPTDVTSSLWQFANGS